MGLQMTSSKIGVRNAHAMAYDGNRESVILFGGADASKVCGDTWEWDDEQWIQISPAGPGPRTFPAMAYDSVRKRIVLFGGNRVLFGLDQNKYTFLDDTWEWNGESWTQIRVPGPPPRAAAVMAFDSQRRRVIMFGGYHHSSKGIARLGDTWEWAGVKWMQRDVDGPAPRNGAALVYDAAREKVVLFGGRTQEKVSCETWEWDGKRWVENRAASTEGRFNCVMAYDEARQTVVRFGGRYGGKPVGDTWVYDGKSWKQLSSTGPAERNHTAMAYDAQYEKIILFGGHDFGRYDAANVLGDTWEWNGDAWFQKETGEIQERIDNGH